MSSNNSEYKQHEKAFALLRRPYITLSDAIKKVENESLNKFVFTPNDVAPFDLIVYNIKPHQKKEDNLREIFRWLSAYDAKQFQNILDNIATFEDTVDTIFQGKPEEKHKGKWKEKDELFKYYKNIIRAGEKSDHLEFLVAVYHLLYWGNIPVYWNSDNSDKEKSGLFAPGWIHLLKHKENNDLKEDKVNYYEATFADVKDDYIDAPKLTFDSFDSFSELFVQVNAKFHGSDYYKHLKPFLEKWVPILKPFDYMQYPSLLYYPVYDGLAINEGVLRGYLGIYCKDKTIRNKVKDHITDKRFTFIQHEINSAFIKGTHNAILDDYMSLSDPIAHWKHNLFRLHNWDGITYISHSKEEIWWTENGHSCIINIDKALRLSSLGERPALDERYIKLSFPSETNNILKNVAIDDESVYVKKRMAEVIGLLDDILVRWQVLKQATKAAISQVMARNMSHNIGSHVLSRFKGTGEKFNAQYTANGLGLNQGLKEPDKTAYFNEYLKNRMDFLADVATADPSMENPMFFLKEMMNGFDKNRILLDRISGVSDSVKFDFKIRRKCNDSWRDLTKSQDSHDPLISVPNDILGCQAFYIIIENIIRNIAKHSKLTDAEKNFTIYLDIEDYEHNKDYYEVRIYDSLMRKKVAIEDLVNSRNMAFNDSILDRQTSQLRGQNLGTIEMEVCAAYLRKLPFAQIEDELYQVNEKKYKKDSKGIVIPNLIYAYPHKFENYKYSLGYSLCIRKPQTLLIFDDDDKLKLKDVKDATKEKLRQYGMWVLRRKGQGSHTYDPNTIYGHDFLIWLDANEDFDKFYGQNYSSLPKRILKTADFDGGSKLNYKDPYETINIVWVQYSQQLLKSKNVGKITFTDLSDKNTFESNADSGKQLDVYFANHGKKWEIKKKEALYLDLICSHHRYYSLSLCVSERHRAEYAECVLTQVVIIDERIQHNIILKEKKYRGRDGITIPFSDIFAKQEIIIPSSDEANLNVPSFGELSDKSNGDDSRSEADKIFDFIINNKNKTDFCIIHLGILEKMLPANCEKSAADIDNKLLKKMFNDKERKKIIITSGRGRPHNLPKDISFISLAILQNIVETLFDKFLLVKLLYNSRRTT